MPLIFDYGESLGDIEVVRLLRVLRTAAVYEAQRDGESVLLKVAHPNCQDQLRREAITLAQLAQVQAHPMLPTLLPAYQQADISQRPYGKTVFRGETKYYIVFDYVEGQFLRDMLLKNPQPWYQHAAWMTISLCDAIAFLHIKGGKFHLNLNPDVVYVRTDKRGVPRPLLLDLGWLSEPGAIDYDWALRYGQPAYTAPEMLSRDPAVGHATDVYGLGLLFYEMLAGSPAYDARDQRDEVVRDLVLQAAPPPLNRTDLSEDVHHIVHMAIHRAPGQRQQDVRALAKMLRTKFGEVPAEKKRSYNRTLAVAVVLIAFLTVVLIMLSALLG
jgi:serine/threonine protein kinase